MRRAAAVAALAVWAAAGCRAPARTTVPTAEAAGAASQQMVPGAAAPEAGTAGSVAAGREEAAAQRASELRPASVAALRAWFNGAVGQPRLLALVSPS